MAEGYPRHQDVRSGFGIGGAASDSSISSELGKGKVLPSGFALPFGSPRVADPQLRLVLRASAGVNNSTTLVNVPDLSFPVTNGDVFAFELMLIYQTNTTADFKWEIDLTSGSAALGYKVNNTFAALAAWSAITFVTANTAEGAIGSASQLILGFGIMYTNGSGVVNFSFAQNVADVSDTILVFGSYIKLERISYT